MAGIRQRYRVANYLNVAATGEETAEYALMGTGFTELEENPTAQTSSKRYVNDKSATKSITGYDWSTPFNTDQIREEKAVDYICAIGENQKTGADAETDYVVVDLDGTPSSGTKYPARHFRVAIEVSSFTNTDGEMGASGNLLGIGDVEIGTFDTSTKTFTAGGVDAASLNLAKSKSSN